ncbi:MAG: hypothetical protein P4L53_23420 [Candidatus Obscuribacterales bacterium]|nr:hypothetical protein [Candidatus Obscuribacterales bacterium]
MFVVALGLNFAGADTVAAETAASKNSKSPPAVNNRKFVSGILFNVPFQMSDAFVSPRRLLIRTAVNPGRTGVTSVHLSYRQGIELTFPQAEKLTGQTFSFKSFEKQMLVDGEVQPAPVLMLNVLEDKYPETIQPTDPYTLALTFYKPSKGMLPGYIDIKSDGAHKTHISGYFYAKIAR